MLIKAGQVHVRCSSVRYSVNGPWSNLMWFYKTEKRKERKLTRIFIPNSLLNALLCHSWLLFLILFFAAFSFRLLLKSCCWESQWDWSVILCQITTMPVGFLVIFLSVTQSKPGIPGWSVGSHCTLCCLLQGWQHLIEMMWTVPRLLPEQFVASLAVLYMSDNVQKLCIHVAV